MIPFHTSQHRTDWVMRANVPHPGPWPPRQQQARWAVFGDSNCWGMALADPSQAFHQGLPGGALNFASPGTGADAVLLNLVTARQLYQWHRTVIVLPDAHRAIVRINTPEGWCRVPVESHTHQWHSCRLRQYADEQGWSTKWHQQAQRQYQHTVAHKIMRPQDHRLRRLIRRIIRLMPTDKYIVTSYCPDTHLRIQEIVEPQHRLPVWRRQDRATDETHMGPDSHAQLRQQLIDHNW